MKRYLFILFIFLTSQINAQIITKININGLSIIDRGTVLNYLPFESGDFYAQSRNSQLRDSLMKTGFFRDVVIADNKSNLNIMVMENPSIKEINIVMDTENLITLDKVKENLNIIKVKKGQIYSSVALKNFIKQIKKVYKTGGYNEAIINYQIKNLSTDLVIINININENEITKIGSMQITGNAKFEEEDLLDLFSIGEADNFIFNYFTKKDNFSKIALEAGLAKLTDFYLNNGYLDIAHKVKKNPNNGKLDIIITVEEGPIYRLGKLKFVGNTNHKLAKLFNTNTGDIFKRKNIINGIQNITDYFADKGHAFAKVDPVTTKRINGSQHLIDLSVNISINQKVYINRITVDGNTRTQDHVLRRELGILEGGIYSNTELDDSITRIKRLGFFEDVSMKISKVKGSFDRINLHFTVIEAKTGKLSIGVSHSNSTGVAFNTGIKEKNIFGTGNTLNAQISYSKAVKDINFYFLDPYFTAEGHSLSYGLFSRSVDGSELESSNYTIDKIGALIGYGVPVDKDSKFSGNLKISTIDISCSKTEPLVSPGSFYNYEKKQCDKDYNSEVYASVSYVSNTLNNYKFPTKGQKTSVSLGVALPVADYRYYKIDINHRNYTPINNNITLKTESRLGVADGYGNRELPFFERYYGGGSSSVRGFKFNSLGLRYPDDTSRGGELSLLGSISVISPLLWVKDSKNMRVSAFVDMGNIYDKTSNFKLNDIRVSAGLAFVWHTPIGPLGIYTAKPLKKKSGDDTKTVDFTLGTSF